MALESKWVYTIVAVTIIITFIIIISMLYYIRYINNSSDTNKAYINYYKQHKDELGISIYGNKYFIEFSTKYRIEFNDNGKVLTNTHVDFKEDILKNCCHYCINNIKLMKYKYKNQIKKLRKINK